MSAYIEEREKIMSYINSASVRNNFSEVAKTIFFFQYNYNPLYKSFCDLLGKSPQNVTSSEDIPFLPISFFKTHTIKCGNWSADTVFRSSGTTGSTRSEHHIKDLKHYLSNTIMGFRHFYGPPEKYCFLGILPGYQERTDSSLIFMVDELIHHSKYDASGFYLNKESDLREVLKKNQLASIPTILFGVSFALLELSHLDLDFPDLIVIETGGMKNSKIELSKSEIVSRLKAAWNLRSVHSEYGMTELLSQSYSQDGKWYSCAPTKKVVIGQLGDPLAYEKNYKTGVIKVMDLANFDTCSFIETEDLGLSDAHGHFQVLGRMDNAELRGCNLLLDDALKDPVR